MAALTPVIASRLAGADMSAASMPAATSGTTGDSFPAGPNAFLRVKNGGAAACTVTVSMPVGGGPLGTTITNLALAPPVAGTTGDRLYGPFPQYPFGDQNGNVTVTYSVTTTVTVAAVTVTD